jgi:hypothetical protein
MPLAIFARLLWNTQEIAPMFQSFHSSRFQPSSLRRAVDALQPAVSDRIGTATDKATTPSASHPPLLEKEGSQNSFPSGLRRGARVSERGGGRAVVFRFPVSDSRLKRPTIHDPRPFDPRRLAQKEIRPPVIESPN